MILNQYNRNLILNYNSKYNYIKNNINLSFVLNLVDFIPDYKFTKFMKRYTYYQNQKESRKAILNYSFDIHTQKGYNPLNKRVSVTILDTNNYSLISKKRLLPADPYLILKLLYKKHKINSFQYRDSIKRLNHHKPLRNAVLVHYSNYLNHIKIDKKSSINDGYVFNFNGTDYSLNIPISKLLNYNGSDIESSLHHDLYLMFNNYHIQ